jgi:hypothetical protein
MITVGEGDTGDGGQVRIWGGGTTASSATGGSVLIRPGSGSIGGTTEISSADGITTFTVADSSVTINTGTVSITSSSSTSIDATTTLTLNANSGILLAGSKVSGYQFGTCSVASSACTSNSQTGLIVPSTSNLAAGASETITMSNNVVTTTGAVLITVQDRCDRGYVMVASVTYPSAGSATMIVTNIGTYACTSIYKLAFFVVS